MSENDTPSSVTKQAIKDGVNWLANWYKERCDAGFISSAEYYEAVERLKKAKIYTTKQGLNRITEELENGNLHFSDEVKQKGASIDYWKGFMQKYNTFPRGWCARGNVKEPAIIIDVDAINKEFGDGSSKHISSTVIHELTHLTEDIFDGELAVKNAMNGINIDSEARKAKNLVNNKKVESVDIVPNIIADTNTPLVVPEIDNAKRLSSGETNQKCSFLNDGVVFNTYLDREGEIYARVMELRYNAGLKADIPVSEEDLKCITYDKELLNRYRTPFVKTILNDVVDNDVIKKQLRGQVALAEYAISKLKDENLSVSNQKEPKKTDKISKVQMVFDHKNMNSHS